MNLEWDTNGFVASNLHFLKWHQVSAWRYSEPSLSGRVLISLSRYFSKTETWSIIGMLLSFEDSRSLKVTESFLRGFAKGLMLLSYRFCFAYLHNQGKMVWPKGVTMNSWWSGLGRCIGYIILPKVRLRVVPRIRLIQDLTSRSEGILEDSWKKASGKSCRLPVFPNIIRTGNRWKNFLNFDARRIWVLGQRKDTIRWPFRRQD